MTAIVMKTTFGKLKPNIIHYKEYKKFSNNKFRLFIKLSTENFRADCNGMKSFYKYLLVLSMNLHRKNISEGTMCLSRTKL